MLCIGGDRVGCVRCESGLGFGSRNGFEDRGKVGKRFCAVPFVALVFVFVFICLGDLLER